MPRPGAVGRAIWLSSTSEGGVAASRPHGSKFTKQPVMMKSGIIAGGSMRDFVNEQKARQERGESTDC